MKFILTAKTKIEDRYASAYYRDSVRQGKILRFTATNYSTIFHGETPRAAVEELNSWLQSQADVFSQNPAGLRERLNSNRVAFTEFDDGSGRVQLVAELDAASQELLDGVYPPVEPWVDPAEVEGTRQWQIAQFRILREMFAEGAIDADEYRTELMENGEKVKAYRRRMAGGGS